MNKRVLVVWNEYDETLYFVDLVIEDEAQFELLKTFHNCYIGVHNNEEEISKFFFTEDDEFRFTRIETPVDGKFDLVIITGQV